LPGIIDAGATLTVISPQVQRAPREVSEPAPLSYAILRDQGNRVAGKYGVVFTLPEDMRRVYLESGIDLTKANGDESWTLPMPARFVVNRDGIIRAAEVNPDYTHRPEPADTIAVLRNLRR
jgi:peroxiredoxin